MTATKERKPKQPKPQANEFATTADWMESLVRHRVYEMERKGQECVMREAYDVWNHGSVYIEGKVKSFEKELEGVIYAVRLYLQPTDDTMVIQRVFMPFEMECHLLDLRENPSLPSVCRGWRGKANHRKNKPTMHDPDSVCLHCLALMAKVSRMWQDGQIVPAKGRVA